MAKVQLSIPANSSNKVQHRSVIQWIVFNLFSVCISPSERFSDRFTRIPAAWLAEIPCGRSGMG